MTFSKIRLFVIMSLLCVATSVSAQNKEDMVQLPRRTVTLSELFSQIERQTGTTFMFKVDNISFNEPVSLPSRRGSVSEMLNAVLPKEGYSWQKADKYIMIGSAAEQATRAETKTTTTGNTRSARFERDVKSYTREHLTQTTTTTVRYDTIKVEIPHDGKFVYPSREIMLRKTRKKVHTPFERSTPPLFALKTNLLWWAANGTINLGGEIGLGKKTTIEVFGGYNRWNLRRQSNNNKKLAHWVIKPEFRYWFCERFNGHFLGIHALYGQYNIGGHTIPLLFDKEYRYEGYAYGGGINYGYHLPLSKRWGLEFTAGVGVLRMEYTKFDCETCGKELGKQGRTYFGPTEAGIKLVFLIK